MEVSLDTPGSKIRTVFFSSILCQVGKQLLAILNIVLQPLDKLLCAIYIPYDTWYASFWVYDHVFFVPICSLPCLATMFYWLCLVGRLGLLSIHLRLSGASSTGRLVSFTANCP